jgi:hypothetical protein
MVVPVTLDFDWWELQELAPTAARRSLPASTGEFGRAALSVHPEHLYEVFITVLCGLFGVSLDGYASELLSDSSSTAEA